MKISYPAARTSTPVERVLAVGLAVALLSCSDTASEAMCSAREPEVVLGTQSDSVSIGSTDADVEQLRSSEWLVADGSLSVPPLQYDATGHLVAVAGRTGDGPGEFRGANLLTRDQTDSIWVTGNGGRIIVLDPSGSPRRTLTNAPFAVHGFTPSGNVFSLMAVGTTTPLAIPYVQIRDRSGRPIAATGPGTSDPIVMTGRSVRGMPDHAIATTDSTFIVVAMNDTAVWVETWTRTEVAPLIMAAAGAQHLSSEYRRGRYRVVAIRGNARDGVWGINRIHGPAAKDTVSLYGSPRPAEKGMFHGVIWHADTAGRIEFARIVETDPLGFAGPNHFYTIVERADGLLAIEVRALRCE